jgi:hypothetical protein
MPVVIELRDPLGAISGSVSVSAACTPPSDSPYSGVAPKRLMFKCAIILVTSRGDPLGSGLEIVAPA